MFEFDKLILASANAAKWEECSALLAPLGIPLISQAYFGVAPCAELSLTFLENALTKARHASKMTGLPALADDSGLCVEALAGAPGVRSARFAGAPASDARNNALLIASLQGHTNRRAWYSCVLVLVRHPLDPQPAVAQGVWYGQIADQACGDRGFGYDPHFWLPEYGLTAAQLDPALKNRMSHRAQAMQQLLSWLKVAP